MLIRLANLSRSTFSALSRRNFRLYFIGQGISLVGGWMQSVAQSWLVLHLTGSGTALGAAAALQFAPSLVLGPWAGVLADRVPKRRLLLVTQSVLALLALVLGLTVATGTVRVWMVYVMAALLGIVNAIDYPTRQAFLYELAGPEELVSAIGLTGTAVNLARIAGPALAGALIATTGLAVCFLANAASFVAVIACLAVMRPGELHRTRREKEPGGLVEGVVYGARTPAVREALAMMAIVGALTYEFSVTLPMLAKFTFGAGAGGLAWLMSSMGVGAAIGGLVTAGRRGEGLSALAVAALGFGITTGLAGAAPSLLVGCVAMAAAGVFAARFTGLSNSIVQLRSAPALRNRVMALWATAFMGSTFVGAPLLGWVGESAGPRWALAVGLAGGLIAAAIGWIGVRHEAAAPAAASEAGAFERVA